MNEISSRYDPKESEDKWYKFWEENNFFRAKVDPAKKSFSIVIPPPNVTGILHMGHALNNTIQDILIRYHRMKGEVCLWMPGTDHAGIATQNVVEKSIAKEGLKRQDLGREKFIERVWQWKELYGSTIIKQLKKLGASCDWERLRFTMDPEYSRAVTEAFNLLYEKGLIYQGSYIINWCPRCQTALSDEEAPHRQLNGNLYYIRYPLAEIPNPKSQIPNKSQIQNPNVQNYIVVATTRPETILGDTAVAVNPKDKRYKHFIGKSLILPLVNREIKIIADSMIDMEFGTGAVKVTPAHDPNDYALGKKHKLEFINVMHPNGMMNKNAGDYKDMDRFQAREVIIEDLKEKGYLEKIAPHQLSAGHCYRCHTIIEPYLSKQWFVKAKSLAKPAIEAVKKGKIKFHPERWTKVYLNWMENIQDWCISRQIWWGHRIPVYYCRSCVSLRAKRSNPLKDCFVADAPRNDTNIIVSRTKPDKCPHCGSADIYQDEDVLDTWFSSWLWPFATFGWPGQSVDLDYFYPTAVLVTAPEIIFFWVARMVMSGFEFKGELPFKDVYIHGTVRDIEGKKMSKSLGNIIDPLEIINEYGTDALRFSLISITSQGQDVYLSKERFEQGRNFANKIWNASRFILTNLDPTPPSRDWADLCAYFKNENLGLINRWILSRFYSTLKKVNQALDNFEFNEGAALLYSFFWHEFCDWYLEIIKLDIKNPHNQLVMYKIMEKFLRALHPYMPFITEEIWQQLGSRSCPVSRTPNPDTIMLQSWPHVQEQIIDEKLEKEAQFLFALVTQIRNLRASVEIKPDVKIDISLYAHNTPKKELIKNSRQLILNLARAGNLRLLDASKRPAATISAVIEDMGIYLHFSGLLDIAKEQAKISDKLSYLRKSITAKEARLKNAEFLKKAPREVVEKEKNSIKESKEAVARLERMSDELR